MTAPAYCPDALKDPITPKTIIGADNRIRVNNPRIYPYSAVMCLRSGWDIDGNGTIDSWTQGTGAMVGSKALLTAGHNYWNPDRGGWVKQCRAYKYQNSTTLRSTYYYPASWVFAQNYKNTRDVNYDWCVVTMQDRIGNDTGYFGYGTGSSLMDGTYRLSGYPADHLIYQYYADGIITSETYYRISHNIDAVGGQSGAPIYWNASKNIWAIHTGGGAKINYGNKITSWVYDLISQARAK